VLVRILERVLYDLRVVVLLASVSTGLRPWSGCSGSGTVFVYREDVVEFSLTV
jgi:hypothetical protein